MNSDKDIRLIEASFGAMPAMVGLLKESLDVARHIDNSLLEEAAKRQSPPPRAPDVD